MYRFSAWFLFFTRGAPCRYLENATGEHFFSQSSPVQHKLCYEVADETRSILAVYIILSNYIVETVGIRWHQEVGGRGYVKHFQIVDQLCLNTEESARHEVSTFCCGFRRVFWNHIVRVFDVCLYV